ncbi:SDR family NAD(P)-dependent oxidoreductase [Streptomonospora arabica]|uniref:SDR family NAD(P)-dependent oxidoreductase n=1 Tax=Streptomonospora arabica TaxID=412417 RepID=A0ABV9SNX3_9ACTN
MTTTLITGANRGLGFEAARRLTGAGHTVYIGARDPERGRAAAARLGARFVRLDVTDDGSVQAAAASLRASGGLDVLVNNAGTAGARRPVGETTADDLVGTFETNVFGVVRVTHAFLPLLKESAAPVVVNVGSALGSRAACADRSRPEFDVAYLDYSASKSALVMLTSQYAKAFPAIRFNAVDPGYTATDLTGHQGAPVQEGAEVIVRMAAVGADGPTGGWFDNAGPAAW